MLARYHQYGPLNSHDMVKCIAIVLMIIDHIGAYLLPDALDLRVIGRFSMPLFLFLVGYSLSYRWKWNLLGWALAVLAGGLLFNQSLFSLNILFAILLTRIIMGWLDRKDYIRTHPANILIACAIWYFPFAPLLSYSTTNILFAVCGYMVAKNMAPKTTRIFVVVTMALHVFVQGVDFEFVPYQLAIYIALTPLLLLVMLRYQLVRYPQVAPYLAAPVKLMGRYSLEIYALHLVAFFALAKWLYPAEYVAFSWF